MDDGAYYSWGSDPVLGMGDSTWIASDTDTQILAPAQPGVRYLVTAVDIQTAGLWSSHAFLAGRVTVYFEDAGSEVPPIRSLRFVAPRYQNTILCALPPLVIPGGMLAPAANKAIVAQIETPSLNGSWTCNGGQVRAQIFVEEQ